MSEIKWTAFGDSEPFVGYKILVAWIKCGVVEEAIGPFTYLSRTHFDSRFTHWCPASVLPPVPAKRDYCREAWEELEKMPEDFKDSHRDFRFVPLSGNGVAFTLNEFRSVWKIAIACAKKNGLEKV